MSCIVCVKSWSRWFISIEIVFSSRKWRRHWCHFISVVVCHTATMWSNEGTSDNDLIDFKICCRGSFDARSQFPSSRKAVGFTARLYLQVVVFRCSMVHLWSPVCCAIAWTAAWESSRDEMPKKPCHERGSSLSAKRMAEGLLGTSSWNPLPVALLWSEERHEIDSIFCVLSTVELVLWVHCNFNVSYLLCFCIFPLTFVFTLINHGTFFKVIFLLDLFIEVFFFCFFFFEK